jgi:hypothetical protein
MVVPPAMASYFGRNGRQLKKECSRAGAIKQKEGRLATARPAHAVFSSLNELAGKA